MKVYTLYCMPFNDALQAGRSLLHDLGFIAALGLISLMFVLDYDPLSFISPSRTCTCIPNLK